MKLGRDWQQVVDILACWRLDDEWWREQPIRRTYWQVLLSGGKTITVFHDATTGRWLKQNYV